MDSRSALQLRLDSEKLRTFIADYLGVDPTKITNEAHLSDDLGLDWLDQLELLVLIEEKFVGVDFFTDTTTEQIQVVGDLVRHIEDHDVAFARRSAA